MEKPVIVAVENEPSVLGAVARGLRREYGEQHRVIWADSEIGAPGTMRRVASAVGEPVHRCLSVGMR